MKLLPIFIIIAIGCLATLPILIYGTSFLTDDGVTQAIWYVNFSNQFWAGDFYPRWLSEMNSGLGSPVFYYYPPLPFFITSLLKPLFPADLNGWHQIGISTCVALIASGLTAYLWLKEFVNQKSAVISAIFYMIAPYHLVSDLYVRGSFAEFWAFVWLPLILYFTSKILNGHKLAVVGLAVSYSFLIFTHLPTTLMFSLIPLSFAAINAATEQKLKSLVKVAGSMMIGIGLSAIFLYPAMTMQSNVFLDRIDVGYFSYQNWLFFSNFDLWHDDKILILLLVIDLAGIACCAFFIAKSDLHKTVKRLRSFWFIVAASSVIMMTDLSRPIWIILPPLQKIQFPWRFNVILSLAVTALLAIAISSIRKSKSFSFMIVSALGFLLILVSLPAAIWAEWNYFADGDAKTITYRNTEIEQKREVPEYRPRWNKSMDSIDWETSVNETFWDNQMENEYNSLIQRTILSSQNKVQIVEGIGQAEVVSQSPRGIYLHIKASTAMKIYGSQFYFPNWKAHIIERQIDLDLEPSERDGLLSLTVPSGDYTILLQLEKSSVESNGLIISLLASLVLSAYLLILAFSAQTPERYH